MGTVVAPPRPALFLLGRSLIAHGRRARSPRVLDGSRSPWLGFRYYPHAGCTPESSVVSVTSNMQKLLIGLGLLVALAVPAVALGGGIMADLGLGVETDDASASVDGSLSADLDANGDVGVSVGTDDADLDAALSTDGTSASADASTGLHTDDVDANVDASLEADEDGATADVGVGATTDDASATADLGLSIDH